MLRPEPSMRSETVELESECQRLQFLVGELLMKNHQLRCEVARLRDLWGGKEGADASTTVYRVENNF